MLQDAAENYNLHTTAGMNARRTTQMSKLGAPGAAGAGRPTLSPFASYLQDIIATTGAKASAIAKRIDVPESTLTRHLPRKDGTAKPRAPRTMHADIVAKLEQFSGIPAPSTLGSLGQGQSGMHGQRELARVASDAVKFCVAANDDVDMQGAIRALVGNREHAEAWVLRSTALECAGYMPGDLLIVDRHAEAHDGDVVCVNYSAWGRPHQAETIMRIYRDTGGMRFVIGATYDQMLMEPLAVDNERTVIMGVVSHSIRPSRCAR